MVTAGSLVYDYYQDGIQLIGHIDGYSKDLVIPETVNDKTVLSISNNAFYKITLNSLKLPNTIISIGVSAFDYCSLHGALTIPDSVESIDNYGFSSNYITQYIIGKGLKNIGYGPFSDNILLTTISVSEDNPYFCSYKGVLYDKAMTAIYCIPYSYEQNFTFPPSVVSLMPRSLQLNDIDTLFIPQTVARIEYQGIFNLRKLNTIHILGNINYMDPDFIRKIDLLKYIYYHGTKAVKGESSQVSNITIYTFNDYKGTTFLSKPVIKQGLCPRVNYEIHITRKWISLQSMHACTFLAFFIT